MKTNKLLMGTMALCGLTLTAGCNTMHMVEAPMTPLAYLPKTGVQTAQFGDIILQQDAYPKQSAKIVTGFSKRTLGGLGRFKYNDGEILYQAQSKTIDGNVFCTIRPTYRAPDTTKSRSCLSDTDSDMKFDKAHFMPDYGSPYDISDGTIVGGVALDQPADYEIIDLANGAKQTLGLRISKGLFSVPNVNVVAINGDKIILAADRTYKIGKPEDLPKTLSVAGARIEFISIDGNTVKYRVLSGFNPDIAIHLIRTTNYVYY